ncbi:MAG: glycosyltransferase family 2 protein, partial [Planktothrix sp.]
MNINIGILAYNEADAIPKMLDSLFQQTLFTQPHPDLNIEICVIPNACTDQTASIAATTLENLVKPDIHTHVKWSIYEIERPGKSNAWNEFVHRFSNPNADYLFMMDADIIILDPQTLTSMLQLLETSSETYVAMDRQIKDVSLKPNKNLLELLSVKVSSLSGNNAGELKPVWICGQLYLARTHILRRIWLPTTLPTQDSFLYSMITTNGFQEAENPERVIQAPSASHIFEAYTNIRSLLRHQKWLMIGQIVGGLVSESFLNRADQEDIGIMIKNNNENNPLWLDEMVQKMIADKGWWLIPDGIFTRRFKSLANKSFFKAILFFPLACVAFAVDLWVAFQANSALHNGDALGHWK